MAGKKMHVSLWCGRVEAPESDYVLPAKKGFVGKHEHALYSVLWKKRGAKFSIRDGVKAEVASNFLKKFLSL